MNILIFGHQGSGKTTHGKYIASKFGLTYLSTGDLLRDISQEKTELGKKVKERIDDGYLIDDQLMWEIIKKTIDGKKDGFLLDGFPRTPKQLKYIEDDKIKIDLIFYIHLDHKVSYQRLLARGRTDDTPDKIKHRLDSYREFTKPLVTEFQNREVPIIHIDNQFSVAEVSKTIDDRLKEYSRN